MGKIVAGYGSEWHLLRLLGRHRSYLDESILRETGGSSISWVDFPLSLTSEHFDREWTGVEFITDDKVRTAWQSYWPTTGSSQNWDAVALLEGDQASEWIFVEAKAHVAELHSDCKASERGGLDTIRKALDATKLAVGAPKSSDWLTNFYQYANRLACLHFLVSHGVPARLVLLYLIGDSQKGVDCPDTKQGWDSVLQRQDKYLGIAS